MSDASPRPWALERSEPGPDLVIFRARFDHLEHPRSHRVFRRLVLETPDWVNVLAFTPGRQLVCVRQFRFGTGSVTLEIPGGMVDPGEDPLAGAARELREETGYTADHWKLVGAVEPNPAFHDNLCHHALALDARPTHEPQPDDGEDLAVTLLDERDVVAAVHAGRIRHSLVIAALARVLDLSRPTGAR